MNSFKLTFESPWALLLLIPALALILLPWFLIPKEQRQGFRKTAPAVFHGALALVLILILAGAGLSRPETPPPDRDAEEEPEEEEGDRFLVIADSRKEADAVLDFLPEDVGLEIRSPRQAPVSLTDLTKYQKVLLLGVSANDLPGRFGGQLALYVEQGGSVLISGGRHSFSLGNMRGTAYETLLPVSFDYSAEAGDSVAMMLVIDCSNSMSGSGWWGSAENLSMAKQGAIRSIETLSAEDKVGIVSFNSKATLRSPLVSATDTEKAVLSRMVSALDTSRGTYYCDALMMAWEELEKSDASVRHVIFLSDGEPSDYGYEEIVEDMAGDGISLSTIAVGYSSYVLSDMAAAGGGRYYPVQSVEELPEIMLGETETVLSDPLIEEETPVTLPGGIPTDLPDLGGYVGTTLKETAELMLQTESGDPILAGWKLGGGHAEAFASDLTGDWTSGWRETNPGRRMLRQILAEGIPVPVAPEEAASFDRSEPETRSWTDLLLPFGAFLLIVLLTDIAVRRLRWKDILMALGRA